MNAHRYIWSIMSYICTCYSACVKVRDHHAGINFLLPPCMFQGKDSCSQFGSKPHLC